LTCPKRDTTRDRGKRGGHECWIYRDLAGISSKNGNRGAQLQDKVDQVGDDRKEGGNSSRINTRKLREVETCSIILVGRSGAAETS
jgi:hypothetical protein